MARVKRPREQSPPRALTGLSVLGDFLSVTWRMATPVLLGAAIGLGIDQLLASAPIGFLIAITTGFLLGIASAVRFVMKINKEGIS